MSAITAAGLVCVPSLAGIRHSPREYTSPEDGAKGANGLLNARLIGDETENQQERGMPHPYRTF
jgi:hypothetical protein